MKKILQYLFEHKTLSKDQAYQVLTDITAGKYNEHEITAFTTVFLMRSITVDELTGFRQALLEQSVTLDFGTNDFVDIVGTGGDGKHTFNISTLACFIVAGTGQKVVKHGNYGATSISGSSNVMEQTGYKFTKNSTVLQSQLDNGNICFLHAPLFHPALKSVAGMRKSLAIRTFFNMLGPLVNPAKPKYQVIGTYNNEMLRIYNYLLQQSAEHFTIVHSLDGYDEISLTGDTKVTTESGDRIYSAIELGKRSVGAKDIEGGNTTEEAAKLFMNILNGKGTWAQNAVVLANAALALFTTQKYATYNDAYLAAVDSLESGKALGVHQKLIA